VCLYFVTGWYYRAPGHTCCSSPTGSRHYRAVSGSRHYRAVSGSRHYRAVSNTLGFYFLNRLSVGWAWNPFVHEYWQFLTVYALFRIGLYKYFQRCVWRLHVTETDCFVIRRKNKPTHKLLLLLLLLLFITFVPFIPETISLGYIVLQLFVIYHLWYV